MVFSTARLQNINHSMVTYQINKSSFPYNVKLITFTIIGYASIRIGAYD